MNSKNNVDIALLFTLWASLSELRPDRVKYYNFILDAWNLKPTDVCSVGVKPD